MLNGGCAVLLNYLLFVREVSMYVDLCQHCKTSIYSNDDYVSHSSGNYHIECAEEINLPEDEIEDE